MAGEPGIVARACEFPPRNEGLEKELVSPGRKNKIVNGIMVLARRLSCFYPWIPLH